MMGNVGQFLLNILQGVLQLTFFSSARFWVFGIMAVVFAGLLSLIIWRKHTRAFLKALLILGCAVSALLLIPLLICAGIVGLLYA